LGNLWGFPAGHLFQAPSKPKHNTFGVSILPWKADILREFGLERENSIKGVVSNCETGRGFMFQVMKNITIENDVL